MKRSCGLFSSIYFYGAYSHWFVYNEQTLHLWDKVKLITVGSLFGVFTISVYNHFTEKFCFCVYYRDHLIDKYILLNLCLVLDWDNTDFIKHI